MTEFLKTNRETNRALRHQDSYAHDNRDDSVMSLGEYVTSLLSLIMVIYIYLTFRGGFRRWHTEIMYSRSR